MPDFTEVRARLERFLDQPNAVMGDGSLIGGIVRLKDLRIALAKIDALEKALSRIAKRWSLYVRAREDHAAREHLDLLRNGIAVAIDDAQSAALAPLPTVEGEGKEPAGQLDPVQDAEPSRSFGRENEGRTGGAHPPTGASPSTDPFAQYEDCAASQGESGEDVAALVEEAMQAARFYVTRYTVDEQKRSPSLEEMSRREALEQADLLRRLAAALQTRRVSEEEIARLIEPSAFRQRTKHHSSVFRSMSLDDAKEDARSKARAILALFGAPTND